MASSASWRRCPGVLRVGGAVVGRVGFGQHIEAGVEVFGGFGGQLAVEVSGAGGAAVQVEVAGPFGAVVITQAAVGVQMGADAFGQHRQPGRVEGTGVAEQFGFDLAVVLGGDLVRQFLHRLGDHPGMLDRDLPRGDRSGGGREDRVQHLPVGHHPPRQQARGGDPRLGITGA